MKNRIEELDSLRGIAALMVVFFHFTLTNSNTQHIDFGIGSTGVDLFFIISGFVILMTLERCKSWKDFVVSRFSRLYPAYWVCVTITGIATFIAIASNMQVADYNDLSIGKYVANMTMLQYWLKIRNIDGPYWTLTIELCFYGLMLLVFLTKKLTKIELIGSVLLGYCLIYNFSFFYLSQNKVIHLLHSTVPVLDYFPLFYAGILVYKMKFEKINFLRYLSFVLCLIAQVLLFKKIHHNKSVLTIQQYGLMIGVYGIIFTLFLVNRLKFIINKISIRAGEISYSLYLIHQFISVIIVIPFLTNVCKLNFVVSCTIALLLVILVSYLINRLVEKPALSIIRNWYKNR